MCRWFKKLKSQAGFTLTELVMGIALGGLVLGLSTQIFSAQMDTYNFLSTRKTSMADLRYAMNRMGEEFKGLSSGDIQTVGDNSLTINVEDGGGTVTYDLQASGDSLAVFRGGEKMLDKVQSMDFKYYDASGSVVVANSQNIANIRQIEVTITLEEQAKEGAVSLTSRITPRAFIYEN